MRLPKHRRITRSSEFRRVREEGRTFQGRYMVLGVLKAEELPSVRVGFITTKRLGNAVTRNLIRRRMRSVITELGDELKDGYYLVTIARHSAVRATRDALRKEWKWLGHQARVFRKRTS